MGSEVSSLNSRPEVVSPSKPATFATPQQPFDPQYEKKKVQTNQFIFQILVNQIKFKAKLSWNTSITLVQKSLSRLYIYMSVMTCEEKHQDYIYILESWDLKERTELEIPVLVGTDLQFPGPCSWI